MTTLETIVWIVVGFGLPSFFLYDGLRSGVADYGAYKIVRSATPGLFWMAMFSLVAILLINAIIIVHNVTV